MDTEQKINQIIEEKTEIDVNIRHKISLLNSDLYSGPLYFDKDGDECSMFDFDAKPIPFDFSRVAGEVMDYLRDHIPSTVFIDMDTEELFETEPEGWTDEDTGEWIEPFFESIFLVEDVYSTLLGRELYNTISRY